MFPGAQQNEEVNWADGVLRTLVHTERYGPKVACCVLLSMANRRRPGGEVAPPPQTENLLSGAAETAAARVALLGRLNASAERVVPGGAQASPEGGEGEAKRRLLTSRLTRSLMATRRLGVLVPVKAGPLLGARGDVGSIPTGATGRSSVVVAYAPLGESVYLFDPLSAERNGPPSGIVTLEALLAAFDVSDELVITREPVWNA